MDPELKRLLGELNDAFAQYRRTNDSEREALRAHITTLQTQVRDLETAGARQFGAHSGVAGNSIGRPEARAAFTAFLRGASPEGMAAFAPQAALSTSVASDGGFAVPQEIADDIVRQLRDLSPLRQLARVRNVRSDRPDQLVNVGGIGSGWVGELDGRDETDGDEFALVTPPMGEVYAQPAVTQRLLDDAENIGADISASVAEEFAVQEGAAFVSGTGQNKAKGFLTFPTSTDIDSVRPFGTLQRRNTGAAGAFAAVDPGNVLIDLVHDLRAPYRQNAAWVMNSKTLATVRKLKDGQDNYLWRPGIEKGAPNLLLGYPVYEDANMPDIAADSLSIAFGLWSRGYMICDHVVGVRMLRDAITTKGRVKFYTTKRVGGSVLDTNAIKILKFAA